MWRKYSLSKPRQEKIHVPIVIFDRRIFGGTVYYRVICHHKTGMHVKEWLSLSFLSKKHLKLVADFDRKFLELY